MKEIKEKKNKLFVQREQQQQQQTKQAMERPSECKEQKTNIK